MLRKMGNECLVSSVCTLLVQILILEASSVYWVNTNKLCSIKMRMRQLLKAPLGVPTIPCHCKPFLSNWAAVHQLLKWYRAAFPSVLHVWPSISSGLLDSIIKAVLLYFTTVNIFKYISIGVRILLHLAPSKIWGGVILILGILILPVSISWWLVVLFLAFADIDLTRHFQLFMVSMYFIVSGLFVLQSKWRIKIAQPKSHRVELYSTRKVTKLPFIHRQVWNPSQP